MATAVLTAPLILAGALLGDALFLAFGTIALCLNYVAVLGGLRFVRPSATQ